ncbi:MAG: CPBP family intramembrane glutamic endopeptidase [Mariniphaga sp.]
MKNEIRQSFQKSILITACLTIILIYFNQNQSTSLDFLISLPFFFLAYLSVFSIGKRKLLNLLQNWIRKDRTNVLIFPSFLLIIFTIYQIINGYNLLKDNFPLVVYILFFPVIAFTLRNETSQKIGWFDFTVFFLTLLPTAFTEVKQQGELPFIGKGFDSMFHIMTILTTIYAFGIVRGINEVGFFPEWKWKSFLIAVFSWVAFYLLVLVIGFSVDFIRVVGYSEPFDILIRSIIYTLIGTFLHTALFEELFFRGILQNMLAKRIGQASSWKIFWGAGFVILFGLAILVGYTLEGQMKWFPALVTILLFVAAWYIEQSGKFEMGVYTSLALTGVTFGLVHYHAKSIVYIGLACVAGWAYGYTYIKTKNVFYSAIVHTLVNTSVLIFGLKMMR